MNIKFGDEVATTEEGASAPGSHASGTVVEVNPNPHVACRYLVRWTNGPEIWIKESELDVTATYSPSTDHAALVALLEGLQLAVDNSRDYDTLRSLIGDAAQKALTIVRSES